MIFKIDTNGSLVYTEFHEKNNYINSLFQLTCPQVFLTCIKLNFDIGHDDHSRSLVPELCELQFSSRFNPMKSSRIQFSNPVNSKPRVTASVAAGWVKRTTRVERDDVSQERFCQGISRVAEKRYTPCKRANWYVSTATRFYKAIRYHVGIRNAFIPSKEYLR